MTNLDPALQNQNDCSKERRETWSSDSNLISRKGAGFNYGFNFLLDLAAYFRFNLDTLYKALAASRWRKIAQKGRCSTTIHTIHSIHTERGKKTLPKTINWSNPVTIIRNCTRSHEMSDDEKHLRNLPSLELFLLKSSGGLLERIEVPEAGHAVKTAQAAATGSRIAASVEFFAWTPQEGAFDVEREVSGARMGANAVEDAWQRTEERWGRADNVMADDGGFNDPTGVTHSCMFLDSAGLSPPVKRLYLYLLLVLWLPHLLPYSTAPPSNCGSLRIFCPVCTWRHTVDKVGL